MPMFPRSVAQVPIQSVWIIVFPLGRPGTAGCQAQCEAAVTPDDPMLHRHMPLCDRRHLRVGSGCHDCGKFCAYALVKVVGGCNICPIGTTPHWRRIARFCLQRTALRAMSWSAAGRGKLIRRLAGDSDDGPPFSTPHFPGVTWRSPRPGGLGLRRTRCARPADFPLLRSDQCSAAMMWA